MKIAVLKETFPGERRVALTPAAVAPLKKAGCEVIVEAGAGVAAGYPDSRFVDSGATVIGQRSEAYAADIVTSVRTLGTNPEAGKEDLQWMRSGQLLVGTCDPLGNPKAAEDIANTGASLFGLELIPRITRAQSMDILSSMACIAGYRAVLIGAVELPKMFPLMMTAAGTISPARVFVIGAGVAGLQAIATAKRLGAVVHAYDVRPAVREQCESLGAKFVELELDAGTSEDKGGYAKAMGEEFYVKQRALMAEVVAESDVVITTAAIPGRQSPLLITADAVKGMQPGSVIVDLAAERGGNCELSRADERTVEHDITILGPTNLPSEIPFHASQMFGKNVTTFLLHLISDGKVELDLSDEITRDTLVTHEGQIVNNRIRQLLEMEPLPDPQADANADNDASNDAATDDSAKEMKNA
ncbi:Re/Si-specific NAD(P)(+) transhydrogenase subunit alpha [Planctomycetota bacterium]